jgi:hypothetical protein
MREAINDGVSALFAKKRRWPMLVLPAVLFLHGSANGAQSDAQAQSVADDASQAQAVRKASEAADIETIDQLTVQHGRVAAIGVAVIGIYQPMNLSKRTDRPAVHVGRMQLILRDGQSVMLEAGDRGIRDAFPVGRSVLRACSIRIASPGATVASPRSPAPACAIFRESRNSIDEFAVAHAVTNASRCRCEWSFADCGAR